MPTPTPKSRRHALLLAALVLAAGAVAQADDDPWDRKSDGDGRRGVVYGARKPPSFSAPMVVLLVALIATFFFIGFFSIYIRQCGRGNSPTIPAAAFLVLSRQQEQQQARPRGLDPEVVASFPAMTYAEARALRDKDGDDTAVLECAVCLSEFEDGDQLRLLPKCSHAFHPDCIGEWLAGHVTCPVCRCSLAPEEPAPAAAEENSAGAEEQRAPEVAIDMDPEGDGAAHEERMREAAELERIGSLRRAVRSRSGRPFSRAHSTGHSLSARFDGDLERFTLRLPEHVRRDMVAAGEESLRRTVARDAGARSARIGRSDRWPSFIARTFSSRVPFWAASRRAPDAEPVGAPAPTTPTAPPLPRTVREKAPDGSVVGSATTKGSVRFDCLGGRVDGDSEEEPEEEKAIVRRV
ncbi:hypothetical protein CFC21_108188 [Triticum aestivum]|uniref:RING-type E3 ubiquitin transferase n=3 Tax=Triticinae TaxID=1648030 RepID=A0A453R4G4_AEGTS|nr:E3 ubiquitin-protein ligase ATL31 [Aegilops tauschii subsp. strangulata]XP_044443634.1 E3 ubiquitin-protein ligase ATL31-like [Triticum aestivum]KAF7107578.1 hypothetical protein CFC21_108188 [Triticum aestivum]